MNGHLDIVKLLVKDPRVDPSDYHSCAIFEAFKNNHIETTKYLWKNKKVRTALKFYNEDMYYKIIKKITQLKIEQGEF